MQQFLESCKVKSTKPNFNWQHQFNDERIVIDPMKYTLASAKEQKA